MRLTMYTDFSLRVLNVSWVERTRRNIDSSGNFGYVQNFEKPFDESGT